MSFDLMIQYTEGASKKGDLLIFVLFISQWLEMKNSNEIEEQKAKHDHIFKKNTLTSVFSINNRLII